MVASLIVTGWLLEGAPDGLAVELDDREEHRIVDEIGRLPVRLSPGCADRASG